MLHPVGHQRAAAADDAGDAFANEGHMFAQDAGVNGHVIDALLGLLLNHFKHQLEGEIFGTANAGDCFVNGDSADRNGRSVDDGLADGGNVAASAEIHDGIRAVMHGVVQFLQLLIDIGAGGGVADVGVDFAFGGDTNGHRLKIAVMNVGGDDAAATRHFTANQVGLEVLALGDVLHLFG